ADGARELAHGDDLAGAAQPLEVAPGLHVPDGHLEPEGRGLGMHAMCAAHDQRVLVLHRKCAERPAQSLLALEQQLDRVVQLQRRGRVPDVVRRQTDVDEPRVPHASLVVRPMWTKRESSPSCSSRLVSSAIISCLALAWMARMRSTSTRSARTRDMTEAGIRPRRA